MIEKLARRARIVRSDAGSSRWVVATRSPAPQLRAYVRDLTGYTEHCSGLVRRRELPGPQVVLIVELAPPIRIFDRVDRSASRYPGGFVAGIDDRHTFTEHDGFQHGVQVNLTPIGARLFLGVPMAELARRTVSLGDLLPREHDTLAERLEGLASWDARFDVIDHLLAARIGAARVDTRVVSWAYRRIEDSGGAVGMGALARELGYSQKHVIHMFREHVGVPPKLLARIVRFDRLIRRLRSGAQTTWAELALDLGYYDQAHLVREVKALSGTTPTDVRGMVAELAGTFG